MSLTPSFTQTDVVHAYSRAQAIEDGVLVDVTAMAREAGFRVPVALTAVVWADCVAWDGAAEPWCQDETGRLWDLLHMAALAARQHRNAQAVPFDLLRVPRGGSEPKRVRLTLHVGPGDDAAPVITILQPGED